MTAARQSDKIADARSATVSRTSGAPLKVLVAAFGTRGGDSSIVEDDDAFYVMRVNKEINPAADAAKKASLRKELQTMSAREYADDYNGFLKRKYPIKVNEKVYNKVFAQ